MANQSTDEYIAFQRLQDGLSASASAARELSFFRSDQSKEWQRMAELYEEAKAMAFQLVGGGEVGKARN